MGLVVPTEANSEVGVVDAGVTFDLQRGLLQPVAAQHPLDRNADVAAEYPLRGARTPRRVLHHLLHTVQPIVLSDPVDQLCQLHIGRSKFDLYYGLKNGSLKKKMEMKWKLNKRNFKKMKKWGI